MNQALIISLRRKAMVHMDSLKLILRPVVVNQRMMIIMEPTLMGTEKIKGELKRDALS